MIVACMIFDTCMASWKHSMYHSNGGQIVTVSSGGVYHFSKMTRTMSKEFCDWDEKDIGHFRSPHPL